ncbi:MAG: antibiotic biosynthesis monooxygenase [Desulfovibrio sp.]
MIAREWRCRCPKSQREGFLAHLRSTGVKDTSATPGFRGEQILERDQGNTVEITLISYWNRLEDIVAFAGEDIAMARLYPGDEAFEIVPDHTVRHYEVLEQRFTPGP